MGQLVVNYADVKERLKNSTLPKEVDWSAIFAEIDSKGSGGGGSASVVYVFGEAAPTTSPQNLVDAINNNPDKLVIYRDTSLGKSEFDIFWADGLERDGTPRVYTFKDAPYTPPARVFLDITTLPQWNSTTRTLSASADIAENQVYYYDGSQAATITFPASGPTRFGTTYAKTTIVKHGTGTLTINSPVNSQYFRVPTGKAATLTGNGVIEVSAIKRDLGGGSLTGDYTLSGDLDAA